MKFSVFMSVYKNTKKSELIECLNSLASQTVRASEIVVVVDGAIGDELNAFLTEQERSGSIKLYPLLQNVGLSKALRFGIEKCEHELIARMDTDDICKEDRMEKQLACFEKDPDLSVVGTAIEEFIDKQENVVACRDLPQTHEEICAFLKKRCPFNHMTVMYKKSEVLKAGNYPEQSHYNEDYYLWINMFLAGARFKNLPERLVYARIDEQTFLRRGGWKYYRGQAKLFRYMKKNKVIGFFACFKAKLARFVVQVLMPNKMRARFYKKRIRNKA